MFCVGHGWSFGSDLYAGAVIGPVMVPAPRAAVSSTALRSTAHWMARRTSTLLRSLFVALSCRAWYASCGVEATARPDALAVFATTGSSIEAIWMLPACMAETIDCTAGITRNCTLDSVGFDRQ